METEVKESNSMWNKSGYDVLGQVEDHREMVYSAAIYNTAFIQCTHFDRNSSQSKSLRAFLWGYCM